MKNKESEKLGELEKGYRLISEELDSRRTISKEFVESAIISLVRRICSFRI